MCVSVFKEPDNKSFVTPENSKYIYISNQSKRLTTFASKQLGYWDIQ